MFTRKNRTHGSQGAAPHLCLPRAKEVSTIIRLRYLTKGHPPSHLNGCHCPIAILTNQLSIFGANTPVKCHLSQAQARCSARRTILGTSHNIHPPQTLV
jgi:hypothetical protein